MRFLLLIFIAFQLTTATTLAAESDVVPIGTGSAVAKSTYIPIVGVPGLEKIGDLSTQQYVEALYKLSITIGAMLAVIQIIFAGVQYMLTDVITSKSAAIERIRGALLGLLILLSAVLILQTINSDLLKLNIFTKALLINEISNPVVDTRTECQKNVGSKECCDERGGNFIKNAAKSAPSCSVGSKVVLPDAAGENAEEKRIFCLSTPGMEWDGSDCRTTTGKAVPFPPGYTDDDGKDDIDRANYCREAFRGDYNADKDTCIVNL